MSEINPDNPDNLDNPDNPDVSYSSISYSSHNEYSIVLFIDNNIKDYETLIKSCNSNTLPIVYSYSSTKTDILNTLSMFTKISRIGICTDSNATLFLDNHAFFLNTDLNLDNSMNYSENLTFIISLIKQYNVLHIDYLACNSLNNSNWENYYQILISSTNVILGASNNNTGNIKYGGDWITESNYQDVEFIYFTQNIEYYQYLLGNNFYKNTTDITTNFSSITQLTSFPTFNGTSNFSTNFFIKIGSTPVDLALLYALKTVPSAGTYTTEMYGYSNGTKYDLSYFFAPIPSVTLTAPTFNGITNYQVNQYTYYIFGNTTFTVSKNSTAYVLVVGGGGAGNGGLNNNGGGGGGGAIFANINLRAGQTYTATIGAQSTIAGNSTSLGVTGNTLSFTAFGGGKGIVSGGGAGGGTTGLNSTDVINPPAIGYNGGVGGVVGGGQVGGNGTSLNTSTLPTSMYNSTQTFAPLSAFGAGGGGSGNVTGGAKGGLGAIGGVGVISGNNGEAGGISCGGGGARRFTGSVGGRGGQGFIYIYAPPQ